MIYVVRHGETDWNKTKRIQGRTDVPLNDIGRSQALEAKKQLEGIKLDLVFSSPLSRAFETAEILSGSKNIITDDRLMERSFGRLEGMDFDKSKLFDKSSPDYYTENGIETWDDVRKRAYSFFSEIEKKYPGKNILVATHGGVSIFIRCYFEGEPQDGDYTALIPKNCQILVYNNK